MSKTKKYRRLNKALVCKRFLQPENKAKSEKFACNKRMDPSVLNAGGCKWGGAPKAVRSCARQPSSPWWISQENWKLLFAVHKKEDTGLEKSVAQRHTNTAVRPFCEAAVRRRVIIKNALTNPSTWLDYPTHTKQLNISLGEILIGKKLLGKMLLGEACVVPPWLTIA
jgi:hypothetical protein